jgi:lipoprotein-anchoring transpeptidase ErfK/SrfK
LRGIPPAAVLAIAAASIIVGGAFVAWGSASPATPAAEHRATGSRPHRPHPRPPTTDPAPIVIPPAPSTTATVDSVVITTDPPAPPQAGTAGAVVVRSAGAPGAGPRVRQVGARPAPLPRGSSAPLDVTDPSVIATAQVRVLPLYASPTAPQPTSTLTSPNTLGARVVLLVAGSQPNWVLAYVPIRPNETMAWIPAADVAVSFVTQHLVVHLGSKTISLYENNAPVATYPVAPGAPDSPTPTGSFFVAFIVRVTDPSGAYGPYALGTSDFSGTYTSFEGGPGQIGIHGTNQPWVIGTDASHGCIRLYDNDIAALAPRIVPGIPVEVES